jgi:hypothetical protein
MIASLLIDDARITIANARVLTTRRPPTSGALSRVLLAALKELIATTIEDGGNLCGIIDIATGVAIRIHARTQDRPPPHSIHAAGPDRRSAPCGLRHPADPGR